VFILKSEGPFIQVTDSLVLAATDCSVLEDYVSDQGLITH